MNKKLATAVTVLMMVSVLSFANGNKEDGSQGTWGQGYGRNSNINGTSVERPFEQGDLITLNGTLKITGSKRPEIVTEKGTYELMYPYMNGDNLELKDGQTATVKGYDTPAYRWSNDGDEKHLMVTEATINGKAYKLDTENFGPMNGRGNGMHGSRMASSQTGKGSGRIGGRWQ